MKLHTYTGRVYVPHHGWLDPETDTVQPSPRPERELQWFGRNGSTVYGSVNTPTGLEIYTWELATGKVDKLCATPDVGACAMTKDGSILDVTVYGQLLKFAPGGGEILKTWNIGGKIYMASYCNGYLTEFDPKRPGTFPENPRVITQTPEGMRPVADALRDKTLYYACTHHYGILGCTLTKYDTETAQALHVDDPIPNQHIISLAFDARKTRLFGGTAFHSDCDTTAPGADMCYIAQLSPDTLEVLSLTPAPQGCAYANVIGALDDERMLLTFSTKEGPVSLWQYSLRDGSFSPLNVSPDRYNAGAPRFIGTSQIYPTDTPGLFVIKGTDRTLLCRITDGQPEILREIFRDPEIYGIFIDGQDVNAASKTTVYVAEGALNISKEDVLWTGNS